MYIRGSLRDQRGKMNNSEYVFLYINHQSQHRDTTECSEFSLEGEVWLLETSGLKDTIFVFYLPKSLPFTKIGKKTLLSKKDKFDTKT